MVIERTVQDTLFFAESINTNIKGLTVSDTLVFIDDATPNFHSLSDTLEFVETIKVNRSIVLGVSDALVFADSGSKGVSHHAIVDGLVFADEVDVDKAIAVRDTLTFVETITGFVGYGVRDTLVFTETIGLQKKLHLTIVDGIEFRDNQSGYMLDPNFIAITIPTCGA